MINQYVSLNGEVVIISGFALFTLNDLHLLLLALINGYFTALDARSGDIIFYPKIDSASFIDAIEQLLFLPIFLSLKKNIKTLIPLPASETTYGSIRICNSKFVEQLFLQHHHSIYLTLSTWYL